MRLTPSISNRKLFFCQTKREQEAREALEEKSHVHVPELAMDIVEQISFVARESEFIDAKSGVSARMSITALQNRLSAAERRMLQSGDSATSVRLGDFMGIIPAITGKVELVYEGEQEGAAIVAQKLINKSIRTTFARYFQNPERLKRNSPENPYRDITNWFGRGHSVDLMGDLSQKEYQNALSKIPGLDKLVQKQLR